jgi:hypothetical protein
VGSSVDGVGKYPCFQTLNPKGGRTRRVPAWCRPALEPWRALVPFWAADLAPVVKASSWVLLLNLQGLASLSPRTLALGPPARKP